MSGSSVDPERQLSPRARRRRKGKGKRKQNLNEESSKEGDNVPTEFIDMDTAWTMARDPVRDRRQE